MSWLSAGCRGQQRSDCSEVSCDLCQGQSGESSRALGSSSQSEAASCGGGGGGGGFATLLNLIDFLLQSQGLCDILEAAAAVESLAHGLLLHVQLLCSDRKRHGRTGER